MRLGAHIHGSKLAGAVEAAAARLAARPQAGSRRYHRRA
jgi:hypothetical protein